MGTHIMKTTIDITDDLAIKAKELAAKGGTTLRAVVEQGIRMALEDERLVQRYQLPDRSVQGRGLQPEFQNKPWSDILGAAHEGRSS